MPVPLPAGVATAVAEVKTALAALEQAVEERKKTKAATTTVESEQQSSSTALALEAAVAAVAAAEAAAGRSLSNSGIDKELSAARRALNSYCKK